MENIINILQKSETCKIQLTIATYFNSSKDVDEEHVMHSKSNNWEVMDYDKSKWSYWMTFSITSF